MTNPTSNYGFVLPTATDLVTDLPADFEVALQGVDTQLKALQPGTTLGDLAYSSATANTNTRLPVGTNGQVLAVVAGVPAWIANDQGDITEITAGTGITVTSPTGPVPTVSINTAVTADLTTAQTLTNKKLSDSTTTIVDATDATKAIKFDVAGTTGITGTIATAFTTAKTVTIPDTTGTVALTNGVVNNTLTTTTGDIIYASAANTPARLGIGSTNQVLTVAGGIPSWATTASATLTIAQIATGTLSGATTTISGLSSYNDIWIQFLNVDPSATAIIFMRLNNNTTAANYVQYGFTNNGSSNAVINPGSGAIRYNPQTDLTASPNNVGILHLSNCKNAGFTTFDLTTSYDSTTPGIVASNTQGIYKVAEALSSIVLAPSGGTFDGGTYTVFGG